MTYTIGAVAKKLHLAPSTLRYYDQSGLLPSLERSPGGVRIFQESDLELLSIIECLKETGMAIKEIKQFVDWCMEGDDTIPQRLDLITRQRQAVLEQMQQLKNTLEVLDYKQWYYETAQKAGTCTIHDTMPPEDIPEAFRTHARKETTS
jgi:DNA-binding transcriptional MerR regulator